MPAILIIDQDDTIQDAFASVLQPLGHTLNSARNAKEGLQLFKKDAYDLVITDIDEGGIGTCSEIRKQNPKALVILTTTSPRKSSVIEGIRAGAADYLIKPVGPREFLESVNRVLGLESELPEPATAMDASSGGMIHAVLAGDSAVITRLREQVDSIRGSRFQPSILIQGPQGSGKRLLARHIHELRRGEQAPLVEVDASVLSKDGPNVLVTEDGQPGEAFERAEGGTLVIDQIEKLPLALQKKLTAICQSREESTFLICLSNVDLDEALSNGAFYISLYFQIASKVLEVPNLKARQEDMAAVIGAIVENSPKLSGAKRKVKFSDSAIEILTAQKWSGELEELEERVVEILKGHKSSKEVTEDELSALAS